MKAFSVNPQTKEVKEIDIEMKANTVYSFFNSILVDELPSIREHLIYADANALSQNKPAYFIGEQLVLGEALIVGVDGMAERDATIPKEALESIINYEVPTFYQEVLEMLSTTDMSLYRSFEVKKGEEKITLNAEWVLYTFEIADTRTREFFKGELQKVLDKNASVDDFMQNMAQLAMNVAG